MITYLGQKGYTIPKQYLTPEQQARIRTDLTIRPFTLGAPSNDLKLFPAYRESHNKFYVPHYYGVERFGPPCQYKVSEGVDIELAFHGAPRDYQTPVIDAFLDHCNKVKYGGGLLELHTGWGKTCAGLYILSKLKKKTIIIVHKEFLMNQWIERIQSFLPGARIGKIQGPIIDVKDKDIVLCMLQSLISKEYDQSIINEFGFTIIDEVHHISSQSFSNSLFKLVTKYMLGLSATMDRKDGTTEVFKMFLGDVIHKAERKTDMLVEVRAIQYKSNDDQFNETILDYMGKPQNSSMITKICEYTRRTEFILQTLCDFIQVEEVDPHVIREHKAEMDRQNPNCELCDKNHNYLVKNTCCGCVKYCMPCLDNLLPTDSKKKSIRCPNCTKVLKYEQHYIDNKYVKPIEDTHTIVMAQNLNILHYMYNKIVCKNLASVGYYIGGMSEQQLKQSETKQIILASYSMCSEGLDIPTLNAEFLTTPKTDLVQILGRMLRKKHKKTPVLYDFIDSHDLFQRQWMKRRAYFKKQNYRIIGASNLQYNTRFSSWKKIYEPTFTSNPAPDDDDDEEESNGKLAPDVCYLKI
ncbi:MAG: DEAD/DEAH box helicase [Flavobacterium sp.]